MSEQPRLVHDVDERVFQLVVEDQVAGYAEYQPSEAGMAITHVVVMPKFGGRGFGSRLAEAALDEAREKGIGVLPFCSFVREHMRRNPSYLDLVPVDQRRRFGLAA